MRGRRYLTSGRKMSLYRYYGKHKALRGCYGALLEEEKNNSGGAWLGRAGCGVARLGMAR